MPELVLTSAELAALTGYRRPCAQLAELHRLGFHRARRSPVSGAVILERAHFEAVARGEEKPSRSSATLVHRNRPRAVRPEWIVKRRELSQ